MKQFIPDRLVSARLLKGLSLQDLSNNLNNVVSKQALHKYEVGEVVPPIDMLKKLAEVLEINDDFFYKPQKIQLTSVEFRKLSLLAAKDENRIIEQTKEYISKYLEIEEIIGLPTNYSNPFDYPIKLQDEFAIDSITQSLRESWGLGIDPIYSVVELLEDKNIKIVEIEAGDEFDGMQALINNIFPIIVINTSLLKKDDRKRFTILHELGHMLLPLSEVPIKQKEKYCHQFASAMLFPKDAIFKELGTKRTRLHMQELGALKKQYGISMQAIIMRAKDLSIISDSYCKQLFFYIRQQGWKIDEPFNYSGHESPVRFKQLIFRALAEQQITLEKAAELANLPLEIFSEKFSI